MNIEFAKTQALPSVPAYRRVKNGKIPLIEQKADGLAPDPVPVPFPAAADVVGAAPSPR